MAVTAEFYNVIKFHPIITYTRSLCLCCLSTEDEKQTLNVAFVEQKEKKRFTNQPEIDYLIYSKNAIMNEIVTFRINDLRAVVWSFHYLSLKIL